VHTKVYDAPGYAYGRLGRLKRDRIRVPILLEQLRRGRRPIEFVWIGFVSALFDLGELFLALKKLIDWLKR
jgi:hypothetical protein